MKTAVEQIEDLLGIGISWQTKDIGQLYIFAYFSPQLKIFIHKDFNKFRAVLRGRRSSIYSKVFKTLEGCKLDAERFIRENSRRTN